MLKTWLFAASVVLLVTASPARASYLDGRFSGPVINAKGSSGPALGTTINGEFIYSTDSGTFLSFVINGFSVASGALPTAVLTPDAYSAIFQMQLSPVQQGGKSNSTFTVDLEGLNPWPAASASSTTNALGVLTNRNGLATNLDTVASTFGYYTANADGTNVRSATADLTSISVSVPEPASLALLATAYLAVVARRRKG